LDIKSHNNADRLGSVENAIVFYVVFINVFNYTFYICSYNVQDILVNNKVFFRVNFNAFLYI